MKSIQIYYFIEIETFISNNIYYITMENQTITIEEKLLIKECLNWKWEIATIEEMKILKRIGEKLWL